MCNPLAAARRTDRGGHGRRAFDLDGDGDLDLAGRQPDRRAHLCRNADGRFADVTAEMLGAAAAGAGDGVLAGDYDNDGTLADPDRAPSWRHPRSCAAIRPAAFSTSPPGRAGPAAGAPRRRPGSTPITMATSISLSPAGPATPPVRPARNCCATTATADSPTSRSDPDSVSRRPVLAVVPTDYDNRRDIDLLLVPATGNAPCSSATSATARFATSPATSGSRQPTTARDGRNRRRQQGRLSGLLLPAAETPSACWRRATAVGRFTTAPAPAETADARAAQFIDYDNDGLLDLFLLTARGPRLLRNLGREWSDVTATGHSGGDVHVACRCHVARDRRSGWRRPRRHRRARAVWRWRSGATDGASRSVRTLTRHALDVARQQPLGRRREDRDARRQPPAAARDLRRDTRPGARRHPSSVSAIAPAPTSCACCGRRASCRRRPALEAAPADVLERRVEDRRARSQALVVSVSLHVERRALRVHHRLPRRRRDGLLAGARRAQHAGSRRVRPHRGRPASRPGRPVRAARSPTSSRSRCSSIALQLVAVDHPLGVDVHPNEGLVPSRDRSSCIQPSSRNRLQPRPTRRAETCSTGSGASIVSIPTDSPSSAFAATPPNTRSP